MREAEVALAAAKVKEMRRAVRVPWVKEMRRAVRVPLPDDGMKGEFQPSVRYDDETPPSPPKQIDVYATMRENLRKDISNNGLVRVPTGSKELPSIDGDGHYGWQFYLRAPLLRASNLNFIGRVFWSVYAKRFKDRPFQIAGVEAAAVPVLTSIVLHGGAAGIDCNCFTIRKERKTYGLQNLIEGVPQNLPVVLVDDLTSVTHNAIWHAVNAVRDRGLMLYPTLFVVVFKGRKQGSPRVLQTSIGQTAIESLFTMEDFNLSWEGGFTKNALADALQ